LKSKNTIIKKHSQENIATLRGVNRATISKIENGRFAFSVDYLSKFAWHFDITINEKEKLKQKNSST